MSGILSSLLNNMNGVDAHHAQDAHHDTSFAALDPSKLEFREYYAAACPHCVNMKPAWDAAVGDYTKSGGSVKWRQIECNDQHWAPVQENAALCKDVAGFPTLKMVNTATGAEENASEVKEYHGPRDASSMTEFVSGFDKGTVVATDDMGFFGLLGAMAFGACKSASSEEDSEVAGVPKMNMFSATDDKKTFL